jgi:hypothetical protein
MALQTVAPFVFPPFYLEQTHFQTIGSFATAQVLDAAGKKVGFILRVPKTGTLAKVGFLLGTDTTFQNLKVSFQDVDVTNGDPDGTVDQYRVISSNPGAHTWAKTGIISSDGTDTGTKRSVTRGDLLAIVIEFDSTGGSLQVQTQAVAGNRGYLGQQYVDFHNGTSWAKQTSVISHFALEYDDGSYAHLPDIIPCKGTGSAPSFTTQAFSTGSGSTPDEIALMFQVPFPCKVGGFVVEGDLDGPTDLVLYDSGSTAILTVSLDPDIRYKNGNVPYFAWAASEVTLAINTNYRATVKPTDTTVAANALAYFDVDTAAVLDQLAGGQNAQWSQRTDAGSWTQTATRRPMIGVIITALDDGVAGGGGGETFTGTVIGRGIN